MSKARTHSRPPPKSTRLSERQLATAMEMYRQGVPVQKIAAAVGVQHAAVVAQARRLGIPRGVVDMKRTSQLIRRRAVELYERGHTSVDVGEIVGASPSTVVAWVRAAGGTVRQAPQKRQLDERAILEARKQGKTIAEIRALTGASKTGIYGVLDRNPRRPS